VTIFSVALVGDAVRVIAVAVAVAVAVADAVADGIVVALAGVAVPQPVQGVRVVYVARQRSGAPAS